MLPFTRAQFLAVFVDYNEAIWPLQIAAYVLGIIAVGLVFRASRPGDRVIAAILALMWVWTGLAYHGLFLSTINPAAHFFALLFLLQALVLGYFGIVRDRLQFGFRADTAAWVGGFFVLYAAILYPLLGVAVGHVYPEMPIFGVTPCPVTIFTFGMLLLTRQRLPRWTLVVPFVWSLIGGSAAFLLAVPQDWLLLASGVVTAVLIVLRDRRAPALAAT